MGIEIPSDLEELLEEHNIKIEDFEKKVRDALCSSGICFDGDIEIVAVGWEDYVNYARELLEDVCGDCYRAGFTIDPEELANGMLDDVVFNVKVVLNDLPKLDLYVKSL